MEVVHSYDQLNISLQARFQKRWWFHARFIWTIKLPWVFMEETKNLSHNTCARKNLAISFRTVRFFSRSRFSLHSMSKFLPNVSLCAWGLRAWQIEWKDCSLRRFSWWLNFIRNVEISFHRPIQQQKNSRQAMYPLTNPLEFINPE